MLRSMYSRHPPQTDWSRYLTICSSSLTFLFHLFQLTDYFRHVWSFSRILSYATRHQVSEDSICYQRDLVPSLMRHWEFPDAHFAQQQSKTVNVNLQRTDRLKEIDISVFCKLNKKQTVRNVNLFSIQLRRTEKGVSFSKFILLKCVCWHENYEHL